MKEALAQPEQSWSWVCNECGSREFTSAVSEADFEYLACAGCGCSDFHKESLAQPDYRAVKTYHEGKPVYVSQPEQEPVTLKWQQAPIRTAWGDDMVVASVAIDNDHTLSLYCERDQTPKIDAMFAHPQQEPVAWGFRHHDGAIYDCISPEAHADCEGEYTVPLYTTPPKPEPRNFCPRCGKRTADLTVIHTCTPPRGLEMT